MSSEITIGKYIFHNVNSVVIESGREMLAATATIKLPNIKGMLERNIVAGMYVNIKLGYDGDLHTEFTGYVTEVLPSIPLTIKCEDEMWKLKQETVSKSWETVKLKEVLEYLVPDGNIEAQDVTLTGFRIPENGKQCSKAKALEEISDAYGLDIYYRFGKLYAGLPYLEKALGTVKYHFQKNVPFGQTNLIFKRKADVKLKVQAISVKPDNTKIQVEVGDAEGETRTLHFYNLTEAELRVQAEEKIKLMQYDGYRGNFSVFGIPRPQHGFIAVIQDGKYPERAGSFFIDHIKVTYGTGGFRRELTLGRKAS